MRNPFLSALLAERGGVVSEALRSAEKRAQGNPFLSALNEVISEPTPNPAPTPQVANPSHYDSPIGPGYQDAEQETIADRLAKSNNAKLAEFAEKVGAAPKGHARKVKLKEKAANERLKGNRAGADAIERRLTQIEANEKQEARGGKSLVQLAPRTPGSYLHSVDKARKAFGYEVGGEKDAQIKAILLDRSTDGNISESELLKVYDMVKDGSYVREYQRLARRNRDSRARKRNAHLSLPFTEEALRTAISRDSIEPVQLKNGGYMEQDEALRKWGAKGLITPTVQRESEQGQAIRELRKDGPVAVDGLQGQGFQDRRDLTKESALASASAGAKAPFNAIADMVAPAFKEARAQMQREIIEDGGSYRDAQTASRQFQDAQGDFAGIALSGGAAIGGLPAKALMAIDAADVLAQLPGAYSRYKTGGLKENLPELALVLLAGTAVGREAFGKVIDAAKDGGKLLVESPQFRTAVKETVTSTAFQLDAVRALNKSGVDIEDALETVREIGKADIDEFLGKAQKAGYEEAPTGVIDIESLPRQTQPEGARIDGEALEAPSTTQSTLATETVDTGGLPKATRLKQPAASVGKYAQDYETLADGNLYREVSPDKYWDHSYRNEGTFWATTPDLATGQRGNKGVLIEFAPAKNASFKVNTAKPGWQVPYDQGAAELKAANAQPTANNRIPGDIVSITIKDGVKVPPIMKVNLNSGARRGEWLKEELPGGGVKFTRKPKESPQIDTQQIRDALKEDPAAAKAELQSAATPSQLDIVAMTDPEIKEAVSGTGVRPSAIKESATKGLDEKLKTDPKETEHHAGLNPLATIKAVDDLEFDTSAGGSFRIEGRNPRDYNILDQLLAPLSIVGGDGKTIQLGTYERVGGDIGKTASETFRKAEQEMTRLRSDWLQRVEGVSHYLNEAFKATHPKLVGRKAAKDAFVSDFIEMVEKPFDDSARVKAAVGSDPMATAIREHDRITDELRNYIIDSRRKQGFDTPDDWGITESGYFRHLFLGDIKVTVDGTVFGRAQTYAEAQKMALDAIKQHPGSTIKAVGQNMMNAVDPTIRVSNGRFWRIVNNLSDTVEVTKAQIINDIQGEIGRDADRNKFLGALLPRKGAKGYSRAYESVMKLHIAQVAKTQELSKLNKAITPIIEDVRKGSDDRPPLPGLADEMKSHLDDLWGTPSKFEKDFGRLLESTPMVRNYIKQPSFAFRNTARKLTELQYWLRLKFNIRGASVNALQPFTTLWPYISTKDFAAVYADAIKPSTRAALKQKGVLAGITKLEGDNVIKSRERGDIFTAMSEMNRSVGYLFGVREAKAKGLDEAAQHKHGLAWAEKVEFDNSLWNVQPVLRSPAARVLGQFKSFSGKNLETMFAGVKRQPGEPGRYTWGRRMKLGAGYMAIGGAKATGPVATAFGGFHAANALYLQLQAQGMSREDAEDLTTAVYFGAPSLIGQDLSGSVAIVDLFGDEPNEILVNYFGGPTVGTAISVGSNLYGAKDAFSRGNEETGYKNLTRAGKAATPYFRQGQAAYQLAESRGKEVQVRSGAHDEFTHTYEGWRAWLYALGFSPVEQSVYWERRGAKIKKADSEAYGYGASEKGAGLGQFEILAGRQR